MQSIAAGQELALERLAMMPIRPGEFIVCEICLLDPDIRGWDLDSHPKTVTELIEHKRVKHGVGREPERSA